MRTLNHVSDTDLILAFQDGDIDAFESLVYRYKDKLFSSIVFFIKDTYLAQDIFQDVFVKIIDTIQQKRYAEEGKFLPWALRIAHNFCIDYFRKIKRTPDIITSDNKDIFELLQITEDAPDVTVIQRQTDDRMRQILHLLPQEQREIIVLRHYANLSFKKIASLTNCSINTALGRMRYALMNLRKIMIEERRQNNFSYFNS